MACNRQSSLWARILLLHSLTHSEGQHRSLRLYRQKTVSTFCKIIILCSSDLFTTISSKLNISCNIWYMKTILLKQGVQVTVSTFFPTIWQLKIKQVLIINSSLSENLRSFHWHFSQYANLALKPHAFSLCSSRKYPYPQQKGLEILGGRGFKGPGISRAGRGVVSMN